MYLYTALFGLMTGVVAQSTVDYSQHVLTSVSLYDTQYQSLANIPSRMARPVEAILSLEFLYLLGWSSLGLTCSREVIAILELHYVATLPDFP